MFKHSNSNQGQESHSTRSRWLLAILILFACITSYFAPSLTSMEESLSKSEKDMELIVELLVSANTSSTSEVSTVAMTFDSIAINLHRSLDQLIFASAARSFGIILIHISQSYILLIILFLLWGLYLRLANNQMVKKLLIIGLFINPGFGLFMNMVSLLDKNPTTCYQGQLHDQLTLVHHDYMEKCKIEKMQASNHQVINSITQSQLNTGKNETANSNVVSTINQPTQSLKLNDRALIYASKKLAVPVLIYMVCCFVLFVFMPIVYGFIIFNFVNP